MRSAVSIFDFFPAVAVTGPTPPERTGARAWARLRNASAAQLAVLIGLTMLSGISISIITTTDPVWWHLHFSQLGTFKNGSAAFFNGGLIAGGILVVVYAGATAREIRALAPGRVRRGAARTTRVMYTIMGVNLALVGCVPLNSNGFVHDRVAGAMVLGFVGLLVTSPFLMHRMPRRLVLATALIFSIVFAGAWVFVTGQINLALFEVISFGAIFAWSGAFLGCLALCVRRDAAAATASAASASAVLFATPVLVATTGADEPATGAVPTATVITTVDVDAPAAASIAPIVVAAVGQTPDAEEIPPAAVGILDAAARTAAPSPSTTLPVARSTADSTPDAEEDELATTTPTSAAPDAWATVRSERHAVPRRRRPVTRLGARHDDRVRPRRGCTASAARAASVPSRTPARR